MISSVERGRLIEKALKRQKQVQLIRLKRRWPVLKWRVIGAATEPRTYIHATLLAALIVVIGTVSFVVNFELQRAQQARWSEHINQSTAAQARWNYEHRHEKKQASGDVDMDGFQAQLCNASASIYGDDTGPSSPNRLSFRECMAKSSPYKYSPPTGLSAEREQFERAWSEEWAKDAP